MNKKYEIEQLIDLKTIGDQKLILVKWKGYPLNKSTWEPEKNLKNFKKEIQELQAKQATIKKLKNIKITKRGKSQSKEKPIQIEDSVESEEEQSVEEESYQEQESENNQSSEEEIEIPTGSYEKKDKVESISRIKMQDDKVILKIKWKKRKNGITPQPSWVSNQQIKKHDPLMLINFYESKIRKI